MRSPSSSLLVAEKLPVCSEVGNWKTDDQLGMARLDLQSTHWLVHFAVSSCGALSAAFVIEPVTNTIHLRLGMPTSDKPSTAAVMSNTWHASRDFRSPPWIPPSIQCAAPCEGSLRTVRGLVPFRAAGQRGESVERARGASTSRETMRRSPIVGSTKRRHPASPVVEEYFL